jgi:hypothetical protein
MSITSSRDATVARTRTAISKPFVILVTVSRLTASDVGKGGRDLWCSRSRDRRLQLFSRGRETRSAF